MKRLLPLILIGVFAAVQQLAAQGMGSSGYAPPSHPPTTSHTPSTATQATNTAATKSSGPATASVTVAAEEKGAAAGSFPAKTPRLYGSFTTTGTNKGDKLRAVWVNSSTKKQLYKTELTGQEENFVGNVSIDAPHGWPPGKYELDIYLGNKMAGRTAFNIKGN
jgi:hypothetical protein